MRPNGHGLLTTALALLMLSCNLQASDPQAVADKIATINEQYRELLQKMQQIEQERRDLELRMHQVADLAGQRGGTDTGDAAVTTVGAEQREQLQAQEEELPDLPRVSSDVGGVLTPARKLIIEPSVQYITTATTRVAVEGLGIYSAAVIGDIDVRTLDRETFVTSLTARYGITNRLEAELKASWVKRSDDTITRPVLNQSAADEVFNADGEGLGDIEFGLRYQFKKRPNWPFLVGNLRIKSDTGDDPFEIETNELRTTGGTNFGGDLGTGSGFWSINPSLTFVMPSDPVAIFGSIGYLWTLEDDKGIYTRVNELGQPILDDFGDPVIVGFGKVDPGDAIRMNFGMGIGLNSMSSISLSYALDLYSKTTIENAPQRKIVGSDVEVGKFLLGYSLKLGRNALPLNIAIGIGTTDAAPDTDITLRMPFTVSD